MKRLLILAAILLTLSPMALHAQSPATLPYHTGFEVGDDTAWSFYNQTSIGNHHIYWDIATGQAYSGLRSLRIIPSADTSTEFSASAFAWRAITVDHNGDYFFSFDAQADNLDDFYAGGGTALMIFLLKYALDTNDIASGNAVIQNPIRLYESPSYIQDTTWKHIETVKYLDTTSTFYMYIYHGISCYNNCPANYFSPSVDNILIKEVSCPSPTNLVFDSANTDALSFHWTPGGDEAQWSVKVGDMAPIIATDTFLTVTNLTDATWYNVGIRAICSSDDSSIQMSGRFHTTCLPISNLPYHEDFMNFTLPHPCWVTGSNDSLDMIFTNSNAGILNVYGMHTNSHPYVLLPATLANIDELELTIEYSSIWPQTLIVGLVGSDYYDSTIAIDTVSIINHGSHEELSTMEDNISFAGHNGQGKRIILLGNSDGTRAPTFVLKSIDLHYTTTDGIGDMANAVGLTVYPNPTMSDVTVKVSHPATINVLDVSGRIVLPPTSVGNRMVIPHSTLPNGLYFVQAVIEEGVAVRKLIVQ